jgi:biopolymer transport protein ExbD
MSRLAGKRKKSADDVEIDMVPIMNMFLVLIPFLLMSASFLHIKAINTSVPVLGESEQDPAQDPTAEVTMIVRILEKGLHLSAISESVDQAALNNLEVTIKKKASDDYPLEEMTSLLKKIKKKYPASDTVLIIPDDIIVYDTIVRTMDAARYSDHSHLFPNVVLSGKVG